MKIILKLLCYIGISLSAYLSMGWMYAWLFPSNFLTTGIELLGSSRQLIEYCILLVWVVFYYFVYRLIFTPVWVKVNNVNKVLMKENSLYIGFAILGGVISMLGAILILSMVDMLFDVDGNIALVTIGLALVLGAYYTYIARHEIPYFKQFQTSNKREYVLDTSVLIDGRVYNLIKSGVMFGYITIPEYVLLELQMIADSMDYLKRRKGQRGLDEAKRIRAFIEESGNGSLYQTVSDGSSLRVDDKLRDYCGINQERYLVTTDYNLSELLSADGVNVLNLNVMVSGLVSGVEEGDRLKIVVKKRGKDREQAIGNLDDGTMVVVEGASNYIGKEITCCVDKVLNKGSGRMLFATIILDGE